MIQLYIHTTYIYIFFFRCFSIIGFHKILNIAPCAMGFPGGLVVKDSPTSAGDLRDLGSMPRLGRSPAEGPGNPLQYSCLKSPMNKEPGGLYVHRAKSQIWLKWLSTYSVLCSTSLLFSLLYIVVFIYYSQTPIKFIPFGNHKFFFYVCDSICIL